MAQFSSSVNDFIYKTNRSYESKHREYEDNFWATKMNLSGCSSAELNRTKNELDTFLGDSALLSQVREFKAQPDITTEQEAILACFEKTLMCYIIEDPSAVSLRETINTLESELAEDRNHMLLQYTNEQGEKMSASSVQLRNLMRTSDNEAVRLSCLESLRSIGPFVSEKFCEIVKLRNQLAKKLGFVDFYDMKVTQAEGFSKDVLFSILDQLEMDTRPIMQKALETLCTSKGSSAVEPHNINYLLSGDIAKAKDPYFPFEDAVDVWARSFAALNISYRGATMRLDLCDRPGKYSNGFCHWPQPAWQTQRGEWVPSQTNFTSLASPAAVGSGHTALVTLMHEGGHAAHFANVSQGSPLFSQERAPTSVAYAENQSMFLDSLVGDAAWLARYAKNRQGEVIPWSLLEREIRETHAFEVFSLRAMLAVPYFEKHLYELPEEEVTPAHLVQLAGEVEVDIQGNRAARPMLSVPHILADESAAYYHGYVLAEMSVHQTRKHFQQKYGSVVDNGKVGKDLTDIYWKPGNRAQFLDLVHSLTGSPLSASSWVEHLNTPCEERVTSERKAYTEALTSGPTYAPGEEVNLDMRVLLVHGDEVVADSNKKGLHEACQVYKKWLESTA